VHCETHRLAPDMLALLLELSETLERLGARVR
jgi:hypothetical protein